MISYRCPDCNSSFESNEIIYQCPSCTGAGASASAPAHQRGNLLVEMPADMTRAAAGAGGTADSAKAPKPGEQIDVLSFLPADYPLRQAAAHFPAGNTPLVTLDCSFAGGSGPQVLAKLDNLNPSGSLKDRASLLVAAQAKYHGVDKVVLASTGNAGSAMSCAGAALGLQIVLFVPAKAPLEKLAQSLFFGATVIPVDGTYDDAFALSIEYSKQFGGLNRNTAYNPMTIEGKKTSALEIYNQCVGKLPDVIYVPVGDGVIYSGLAKGFEDLFKLGLIESMPRCVAVQARGSNAISQSLITGRETVLTSATTLADSISVSSPACGKIALHYLKKTGGWSVEIDDDEILVSQGELARFNGMFVEPSSAVTWAALKKDVASGRVSGDDRVLLLLTGSAFKDMSVVTEVIQIPDAIEPTLEAAAAFLGEN